MSKIKWSRNIALILIAIVMAFTCIACAGTAGPQGERGLQGEQGIKGDPGAKGDKGDPGQGYQEPVPEATGQNGVPKNSVFYSDYSNLSDVQNYGTQIANEIGAQSWILLKNEKNSLPIAKTDPKVSVFGKNSSGIANALSTAGSGFSVNGDLKTFYSNNTASGPAQSRSNGSSFNATGETPQSMYTQEIKDTYAEYNDAAIVVFSRSAGEGSDTAKASFVGSTQAHPSENEGADTSTNEGRTSAIAMHPTRAQIDATMNPENPYEWTPVGGKGREHDPFEHFLQLDSHEIALLDMLQASPDFKNVVVIITSDRVMELGFLKSDKYTKVKSALWNTGGSDINNVLPAILKGTVNPSGRAVDILQADFTADPTWENYAHNFVGNETTAAPSGAMKGNQYTKADGTLWADYFGKTFYDVAYEEGIYLGYKYYETRGFTEYEESKNFAWYNKHVVYPFGHGLSYTTFNWEIMDQAPAQRATLTKYGDIRVQVKVTNTGKVPGMDVVQLYYEAPYYKNGIEKAKVEFADFAKTGMLAPGASEMVTFKLDVRDMASYDYSDANDNGKKGYEVDGGTYKVYVSKNSNSWAERGTPTLEYKVPGSGFYYETDEHGGGKIENRFDYINEEMEGRVLSRSDWKGTWPTRPLWFDVNNDTTIDFLWAARYRATHNGANWTAADTSVTPKYLKKGKAELVKDQAWIENLYMPLENQEDPLTGNKATNQNDGMLANWYDEANPNYPDASGNPGKAPWYRATKPTVRAESQRYTEDNPAPVQLKDLIGKNFDDPLWETYLNQFTLRQMAAHLNTTFDWYEDMSLGIPGIAQGDGPGGIGHTSRGNLQFSRMSKSTVSYGAQIAMASTWNKDLANRYGKANGEFGIWSKIMGWYAPGCNIHRSPFSGRNGQYYSEDGVFSGKMMAEVVKGCDSKGIITFMKHFALNDQETNRDTNAVATWADEQTMRQIYLKPFEIAVKEGGALGMMSCFNRVGFVWGGACYELLTAIPRGEWGYQGIYITDAAGISQAFDYMNANMMIRAGNDLSLDGYRNWRYILDESDPKASNPNGGQALTVTEFTITLASQTATHLWAFRDCVKRSLFVMAQTACMLNGHTIKVRPYDAGATYTNMSGLETAYTGIYTGRLVSTIPTLTSVAAGATVDVSVKDNDLTGIKYILFHGALPEGLTLDSVTGRITGVVAAGVAAGNIQFTIGIVDDDIAKGEEWTCKNINDFRITITA